MNKHVNRIPYPYIGMFDLDVLYETSDIELLYDVIARVNAVIEIINKLTPDIKDYVLEIVNNAIQDGSIFLDTDYDEKTKTLTFVFKKIESEV